MQGEWCCGSCMRRGWMLAKVWAEMLQWVVQRWGQMWLAVVVQCVRRAERRGGAALVGLYTRERLQYALEGPGRLGPRSLGGQGALRRRVSERKDAVATALAAAHHMTAAPDRRSVLARTRRSCARSKGPLLAPSLA